MQLRTVILAFLAARAPAAYKAAAIHSRCQRSGMCATEPSLAATEAALRELASPRLGALVDMAIDPLDKVPYWYATDAGIRRWTLDGSLSVEG